MRSKKTGKIIKPRVRKINRGFTMDEAMKRTRVFLPDMLAEVRAIAWRGATDEEISKQFGVDPELFEKWKRFYPDFRKAIEEGRTHADAKVVQSLYREATGYDYKEEVVAGRAGVVREVRRYARPALGAITFWLENRDELNWRRRYSIDGGRKPDGTPLPLGGEKKSNAQLIADIIDLVSPKPDGEITK